MQELDFYEILQVHPLAEQEVINGAYRQLARKYHPDTNRSPEANSKMQLINQAYETLRDPKMRAMYDKQRAYSTAGEPTKSKEEETTADEDMEIIIRGVVEVARVWIPAFIQWKRSRKQAKE